MPDEAQPAVVPAAPVPAAPVPAAPAAAPAAAPVPAAPVPAAGTLLTPNSDAAPAATESTGGEAGGEGEQVNPDTYADFVMPEGMTVDSELLAAATPIFSELGLTQEQAQKLVDFQAQQVQASSQSQTDAFNQLVDGWQEQSRNDKEFGGDAFEQNVGIAQSAVEKFGTPELKQLLNEHGVGNHPEMIRFMVKVGKLTVEDVPGANNAPVSVTQDRVSTLYPNDRNS